MILVQILFATLLIGPMVWGILNWIKYKGISAPRGSVYYVSMFNSAVLYALAFNVIFFLQELFLVLGKKLLGLKAFLYHNNHTWEGEHPLVLLMQGSGAMAIFLVGVISLVIFQLMNNSKSIWKLFFFWVAFHGVVQSLPQVTIAYLAPETDVGEALVGYLNLSEALLIVLAILCIAGVAVFNIWSSRYLLEFAPGDIDLDNPKARFIYIRYIAVGAAFIGSLLIVPFRIPPIGLAITPFIVFIFSIPWIWSSATVSRKIVGTSNRVGERFFWIPAVLLMLLLIFFQLALAPGVEF